MVTRLDQVSEGAKVPWAAFTIVTPEIDKLPPAIISRCETSQFRPVSFEMGLLHLGSCASLKNAMLEWLSCIFSYFAA